METMLKAWWGYNFPLQFSAVTKENKNNITLKIIWTLAGVAQWIKRGPANQRVAGSIPSQGTCLGCGPGPQ